MKWVCVKGGELAQKGMKMYCKTIKVIKNGVKKLCRDGKVGNCIIKACSWKGGCMDGLMNGWVDVKAILRITCSNFG